MSEDEDFYVKVPTNWSRKSLTAVGIFLLILALVVLIVLTPMMLSLVGLFRDIDQIGMETPEELASDAKQRIQILLFSASTASWLVAVGLGSVLARRWVRPLVFVLACPWIIWGVSEMVAFIFAGKVLKAWPGILMFVLVPVGVLVFYGRESIKQICERENPEPLWTDRCPMPVLVQACVPFIWSIWMVAFDKFGYSIPFYWCVPEGGARTALAIAFGVLVVGLCWGAYTLRVAAWWGAVAYVGAMGLSECADLYTGLYGSEATLDPLGPMVLSTYRGFLSRNVFDWIGNLVELGMFLTLLCWNWSYFFNRNESPSLDVVET